MQVECELKIRDFVAKIIQNNAVVTNYVTTLYHQLLGNASRHSISSAISSDLECLRVSE